MADSVSEQQQRMQTMDEMSNQVENTVNTLETSPSDSQPNECENLNIFEQLPSQLALTPTSSTASVFMKIRLTESDDILLFENNSYTVVRGTADAQEDDMQPTQLATDKEKHQKTNNVETQTVDAHYKTRAINTNHIDKSMAGTFVSNYDMHDTYKHIERTTQSIEVDYADRHEQLDITTYTFDGCSDFSRQLETSKSFQLSSMVLQRVLASNIFYEYQRRFRNMHSPKSLEPVVNYLYRLQLLCRYKYHETSGSAVSCMSWCPRNTDILAVGYGAFKCEPCRDREQSAVCLWNIKNPVNPERCFKYTVPVTAVAFSHENSQLLAIGFYNGSVRIIDVTISDSPNLVAISERKTSLPIEPIWQLKWVKTQNAAEQLLAISQDGFVMMYTITCSKSLIANRQIQIPLNETKVNQTPANRFASLLTIEMHPIKSNVYFVGTGDGLIHECSMYNSFQHRSFKHVHKYGIYSMQFSPWSPKIFLTCGVDWYIRIWIEGIDEPIIELRNSFEPIKCASWCPANSTIIACTTATSLNIWDIKTNCLLPAVVHRFPDTFCDTNTELTICEFTNCGQSIVVGTDDGLAFVFALEDMPFPPHLQYEALEEAITRSLVSQPNLKRKIKQLGFLGY